MEQTNQPMKLHNYHHKKNNNNNGNAMSFNPPPTMFCGECSELSTTSQPPPPPISSAMFTTIIDEGTPSIASGIGTSNNGLQQQDNPQEPNEDKSTLFCSPIIGTSSSIPPSFCAPTSISEQSTKSVSVRSRLRVNGICCPSEVPPIRKLIKPLPGVIKLGINVATKVVFIDHNPNIITAQVLMNTLNDSKFNAVILTDGGLELMNSSRKVEGLTSSPNSFDSASSIDNLLDNISRSSFVESTYFIPGLMSSYTQNNMKKKSTCSVGKLIQQNYNKDEVRAYHVHVPSCTVKVEHDPNLVTADDIMNILVQGLNETIELAHDGGVEGLTLPILNNNETNQEDYDDGMMDNNERKWCRGLKFNVIISGIFWVLSLMSLIGGVWENLEYAGIGSVVFGLPPVITKAYLTIRRCQFDANCMMVTAAFGALALGKFDEAASVSFLFAVSEWLEARATFKARRALSEIISLRPEYANIVDSKTGNIVIVPSSNIPVGSIVSVRTGDKVPADGIVVEGSSSVDESSLTGEARPVDKQAGDDVSGGSINVGSTQLVVQTTSSVGDSTLSRLIQLVEEAQANTSETEKLVDKFARRYTPFVLAIALVLCTVPWLFSPESGRYWMLNGLIIIVIACPCALTISTPVTYSAGLAAAAQRGIIIKGGSKLEALGNVKTVLLDKTGTLTTGRFELGHLDVVGNSKSRKEVLELLAIMEAPSSHPLSACLVAASKVEGIVSSKVKLTEHTILKGEGVEAFVDSKKVYVGNESLFKRLDMYNLSSEQRTIAQEWSDEGGTVGFIGIENIGIIGMYCVKDTVRDEAQDFISSLLDNNIEVIMLTGDGDGAAQAVGKEVGLDSDNIHSQLLPQDKLDFIQSLKGSSCNHRASLSGKKNLILFVGDGVNDAPALAVADVGVAMGEGASIAMEMSDVTLMDNNLSKILFSMKMGKKVIKTVKENIAFSLVINFIAVTLTFLGKMSLLWAIVSDVGVMLLVTLNGMKLLSRWTIDKMDRSRSMESATPSKRKKDGFVRIEQEIEMREVI